MLSLPVSTVAAQADKHESAEERESRGTCNAQRVHYREGVLTLLGIVVIAEQQNLIGDSADLPLRCIHKRQAQITLLIFDSEEVPRYTRVGRQHHESAGVAPLPGGFIPLVPESDRIRQGADILFVAGEEM